MGEIPAEMLPRSVVIEQWAGVDGNGVDRYAAAVTVPAYIEHKRRLVRDRTTGDLVPSASQIWINILAPIPKIDSRITTHLGEVVDIIDIAVFEFGDDSPTPDHVEIICK